MSEIIKVSTPIGLQTPTFALVKILNKDDWFELRAKLNNQVFNDSKKQFLIHEHVVYYFEK